MPRRIQITRNRPWRKEHPDAVIVARPTKWGNPYRVGAEGVPDRAAAVELFRRHLELSATSPALPSSELAPGAGIPEVPSVEEIRAELAGRDLACWCPLPEPGQVDHCHASILLEVANA